MKHCLFKYVIINRGSWDIEKYKCVLNLRGWPILCWQRELFGLDPVLCIWLVSRGTGSASNISKEEGFWKVIVWQFTAKMPEHQLYFLWLGSLSLHNNLELQFQCGANLMLYLCHFPRGHSIAYRLRTYQPSLWLQKRSQTNL